MKSRFFCFTLNNYTESDCDLLYTLPHLDRGAYAEEKGDSGTPHLQGFLQMDRRFTIGSLVTNIISHGVKHPHLEIMRGSIAHNKDYCSKQNELVEFGEKEWSYKGKRNDIATFLQAAEELPELELAREHPVAFAKYHKAATIVRNAAKAERGKKQLMSRMADCDLKPHQQDALDLLDEQGDRDILWIWSAKGNTGKSFLLRWILANEDAFYADTGKHADLAFQYDSEPYACFNFTKARADYIPYSFIESLKDGVVTSSKYKSKLKVFEPPKLIVAANVPPDITLMSQDRLTTINWD